MDRFDRIETERLVMRRWRDTDRDPFAAMNADPAVMRYFPSLQDRSTSDAFVDRIEAHFDEHGFGLWALETAGAGDFIGFTGLNPMPVGVPGEGDYEVGWRLAEGAWGHGYATEAALAALQVGFDGLGLTEIWSITAVLNKPSEAVMLRLGMRRFEEFEHPKVELEHPIRLHVAYRLSRQAWIDGRRSDGR
ncbi:MAG TPA: GNAT family N-acetyltransferase [Nocardioidaceae bacterium]|nr:GNAT family N-acetyltransferase [Nocardioidaceae bacterium]